MKYLLIILIALAGLAFLTVDDDLSATANEWILKLEQDRNSHSEAFIYLSGIMAAEDEEVLLVGKRRFTAYRKAESLMQPFDESIASDDYPEKNMLAKPQMDNEIYCALWEQGCLDNMLKHREKWQSELDKHSVLLARYRSFIAYSEFTTLSKPSAIEEYPRYEYLKYGNRLAVIESLSVAEQHSKKAAIDTLNNEITQLRTQLAVADTLVHKMLFISMIADNLEAIALISNTYNYQLRLDIPYLSANELSVKAPMIREFGMVHSLYSNLEGQPELLEIGGNLPSWLGRIIFKTNKTINESISSYEKVIQLSSLSQASFASYVLAGNDETKTTIDYFNVVGSILNNIAVPDYYGYVARLYDLNGKIALVNHLLEGQKKQLINPYYPTTPNAYEINAVDICLNGPSDDKRRLRCINI
ncbi:MAG: hypothetical protein HRU20_15240 [Pseudomonadales bacterium]|nr:hypothetical protein [Pseudomonadales bacterium]